MSSYDLIVIGGGPAGYVGAIRAAQLGQKVACVEKERAGGTCLNWGCIPTKALLKNAELYHTITHKSDKLGISFKDLKYDWDKIISRSRSVSNKLAGGVEYLFKKNKIDYIRGVGNLATNNRVEVVSEDGKSELLNTKNILISTGCVSRELPFLPFNGKTVMSSKDAMVIKKQPKSITIIGAGAIGIEFAYFFNAFGTDVTVVEMADSILPIEDRDISQALEKNLSSQGIKFLTSSKISSGEVSDNSVTLKIISKDSKEESITSDVCLVAIGVSPILPENSEDIKLDENGFIATDERYQTSISNLYAAGDIIGPPLLAHVASYEAIQTVEGIFVKDYNPKKVSIFPGCTYCHPEVASIGLTEESCKQKDIDYTIGKFPLSANGRALAMSDSEGFTKTIFDKKTGEVLGAHIIGNGATENISEIALAMNLEATNEEIEATIHAHPTLSEAVLESSLDAFNKAIHI